MVGNNNVSGRVAIVGIGSSVLARDSGRTVGALACDAARAAILDSGIPREQIDGVSCIYSTDLPTVWPGYVVEALGLSGVTWSNCASPPSANTVTEGIFAVAAGACDFALCFHAKYRWDVTSTSARRDPMRKSPTTAMDPMLSRALSGVYGRGHGMAAAARRHMHEYGSSRTHLGMIAVNNRTNAQLNEQAVFYGEPMTLEQYLAIPTIIDPFSMPDMDMPIDAAMAVVITTPERARDLPRHPIIVDAAANGVTGLTDQTFQAFDSYASYKVLMDRLWTMSGYSGTDMDVANLYDGFSSLTVDWIEAAFCGLGNAPGFLEDAWNPEAGKLLLHGKIPMSTHGGNLSEGRTQGMGHVLEAVRQLRHEAGRRQVAEAKLALVTNGNNPVNAGMILRRA